MIYYLLFIIIIDLLIVIYWKRQEGRDEWRREAGKKI